MLVRQILGNMTGSDVIAIKPDASISEAARTLSEKKIGAIIVTDEGAPMGILSERDIVRELGRRGEGCLKDRVSDLMTHTLIACAPDDTADLVLTKMTDGRFRHMPVMQAGAMVGLISIGDVVKARLSELSMEREALSEMIMGH